MALNPFRLNGIKNRRKKNINNNNMSLSFSSRQRTKWAKQWMNCITTEKKKNVGKKLNAVSIGISSNTFEHQTNLEYGPEFAFFHFGYITILFNTGREQNKNPFSTLAWKMWRVKISYNNLIPTKISIGSRYRTRYRYPMYSYTFACAVSFEWQYYPMNQ